MKIVVIVGYCQDAVAIPGLEYITHDPLFPQVLLTTAKTKIDTHPEREKKQKQIENPQVIANERKRGELEANIGSLTNTREKTYKHATIERVDA